ncbi:hypothetical protein HALLA_05525 [Halostagnicola larsenii XH-48]|uniref:Uncharacterized protein n=1 Tax=Halostagnicola larsenii XH-48 TaxID=797299 RepID=W0JPR2_9EURY|nr:hypothetical protein HALLA_05525 [Halostagnicola larsenii XH-48]
MDSMSVEHRPTKTPRACVQRTAPNSADSETGQTIEHDTRTREPLPSRIERTRLRVRVAALERELEARETERQNLIDQYELVLQQRDSESEESTADERGLLWRLHRLLD